MKFKKIIGIIQLIGGIALSLTTFIAWEIVKGGFETISGGARGGEQSIAYFLNILGEISINFIFFIFIITLIISLLFMLQGVVNIKE